MLEIKIFIAQFISIYLLGIQQKNVIGGHYLLAFITSLILGIFGWYLTSIIAAANLESMLSSVWWSFVLAGPIAIVTAMKTHPHIVRKLNGE